MLDNSLVYRLHMLARNDDPKRIARVTELVVHGIYGDDQGVERWEASSVANDLYHLGFSFDEAAALVRYSLRRCLWLVERRKDDEVMEQTLRGWCASYDPHEGFPRGEDE